MPPSPRPPAFAWGMLGIAAVGDHHAAIIAHRTAEGFAALPIGHLQVAEPAAAKVVGRMDPPVCSPAFAGAGSVLPGWLRLLASHSCRQRPRQTVGVAERPAASSRLVRAEKKPTDWCKRSDSDGAESSAIPLMEAHAAVCLRVLPPGPRASPRRNRSVASLIPRNRWIARVSRARRLRSRSAGRRDRMFSQSESGGMPGFASPLRIVLARVGRSVFYAMALT